MSGSFRKIWQRILQISILLYTIFYFKILKTFARFSRNLINKIEFKHGTICWIMIFLKNIFEILVAKKLDAFLVKLWGLSGAKVCIIYFHYFIFNFGSFLQKTHKCKSCRSRQELSNEYLLAKIWRRYSRERASQSSQNNIK